MELNLDLPGLAAFAALFLDPDSRAVDGLQARREGLQLADPSGIGLRVFVGGTGVSGDVPHLLTVCATEHFSRGRVYCRR